MAIVGHTSSTDDKSVLQRVWRKGKRFVPLSGKHYSQQLYTLYREHHGTAICARTTRVVKNLTYVVHDGNMIPFYD